MRIVLFILLGTISFSASAQWYRVDLQLKKHQRYPQLAQAADHSIARLPVFMITKAKGLAFAKAKVTTFNLDISEYNYEAAEADIMRTAQHNMRFRIYADASYNFSDLARMYVHQNRFSEAKWFLLQSNIISRQQNDDNHTVANLIDLALIKANIGDYELAQQDLGEAHDIALSRGFKDDLKEIEKDIKYIKQNRDLFPKPELRYADADQNNGKTQ